MQREFGSVQVANACPAINREYDSTRAPQKKTFFTTLNQPDNQTHRDIKEFINHCENDGEGFNFLQDSEIMSRQQQQEQQNVESTFQTQQQQENAFNTFNPTQGSF